MAERKSVEASVSTRESIPTQMPAQDQGVQAAPETPNAPAIAGKPIPPMPKNELMAALSSGFAQAAIGHFGRAIGELLDDPTVGAYYDEIGADVKQALHDRWNQREFETYYNQYVEPMNQKLNQMVELRKSLFNALNEGKVIDPATGEVVKEVDPNGREAWLLRQNYERDATTEFQRVTGEMMDSSQKFAHNPLVNDMMANLMVNQAQTINGIIQPMYETMNPMQEADIRLKDAQAAQARQATRESKARIKMAKDEGVDLQNIPLGDLFKAYPGAQGVGRLVNSIGGQTRLNADATAIAKQRALAKAKEQGLNIDTSEGDRLLMQDYERAFMPHARMIVAEKQMRAAGIEDPAAYEHLAALMANAQEKAIEDVSPVKTTLALNEGEIEDAIYGEPDETTGERVGGILAALEMEASGWVGNQPEKVDVVDLWEHMTKVLLPELLASKFSNDPGAMRTRREIQRRVEQELGKRDYRYLRTSARFSGQVKQKAGFWDRIQKPSGRPRRSLTGPSSKVRTAGTAPARGRASQMTGR